MDASDPKFTCQGCGKEYRWKPETVGRKAKCASCGATIIVPPEPTPPPGALEEIVEDDVGDEGEYDIAEPARPAPPPAPPVPKRVLPVDAPIPPAAMAGPVPPPVAVPPPAAAAPPPTPGGVQLKDCPACGASALMTALVCQNCGFNFRTGKGGKQLDYGGSPGIAAETYQNAAKASWVAPIISFLLNCCAGAATRRGNAVSSVVMGLFILLLVLGGLGLGIFALTGIKKNGKEGILAPAIVGITLNGLIILANIIVIILAVMGKLGP